MLLQFAEYSIRSGGRPDEGYVGARLRAQTQAREANVILMKLAAGAAKVLHTLAAQLGGRRATAARARTALGGTATTTLRQLLSWLAEPAAPVATASAVLAEALPAVALLAGGDRLARQQLTAGGGAHEWAPVAKALHARLPRRMAARFLPEVDRVTAVVTDVAEPVGAPNSGA